MKTRDIEVILDAMRHAEKTVELLANANYPYAEFETPEFKKMYYDLNDMCLQLSAMEDTQKAKETARSYEQG